MGKIGLFEEPPKKWFQFDKDTEVLLQYINKGLLNTILMQGAEVAKKLKAKASDVQDIHLGKAAIFGWRHVREDGNPGFQTPNGEPLPFTPESRNKLMTGSSRFSEWVFRTCTDETKYLEEDIPELEGGDLKGLDELLEELAKEEETPGNV